MTMTNSALSPRVSPGDHADLLLLRLRDLLSKYGLSPNGLWPLLLHQTRRLVAGLGYPSDANAVLRSLELWELAELAIACGGWWHDNDAPVFMPIRFSALHCPDSDCESFEPDRHEPGCRFRALAAKEAARLNAPNCEVR